LHDPALEKNISNMSNFGSNLLEYDANSGLGSKNHKFLHQETDPNVFYGGATSPARKTSHFYNIKEDPTGE
jgi:hypothetical protein